MSRNKQLLRARRARSRHRKLAPFRWRTWAGKTLAKILTREITFEIDNEILEKIRAINTQALKVVTVDPLD